MVMGPGKPFASPLDLDIRPSPHLLSASVKTTPLGQPICERRSEGVCGMSLLLNGAFVPTTRKR